jgi:phospholipid transport system substrate-binding protein
MFNCQFLSRSLTTAAASLASLALSTPAVLAQTAAPAAPAAAAEEAPEALIGRVSTEILEIVKGDKTIQAGDTSKVIALVDSKVMPHVNFVRMTSGAVGRAWREATPAQRTRLQDEFKVLLVRTYSGALAQVTKDQNVVVRPLRGKPEAETLVRTEIRGRGEPLQMDYRMEKTDKGWKIYDLNVLGIWIVQTYQTQFAAEVNKGGVDGLIVALAERNKTAAAKK